MYKNIPVGKNRSTIIIGSTKTSEFPPQEDLALQVMGSATKHEDNDVGDGKGFPISPAFNSETSREGAEMFAKVFRVELQSWGSVLGNIFPLIYINCMNIVLQSVHQPGYAFVVADDTSQALTGKGSSDLSNTARSWVSALLLGLMFLTLAHKVKRNYQQKGIITSVEENPESQELRLYLHTEGEQKNEVSLDPRSEKLDRAWGSIPFSNDCFAATVRTAQLNLPLRYLWNGVVKYKDNRDGGNYPEIENLAKSLRADLIKCAEKSPLNLDATESALKKILALYQTLSNTAETKDFKPSRLLEYLEDALRLSVPRIVRKLDSIESKQPSSNNEDSHTVLLEPQSDSDSARHIQSIYESLSQLYTLYCERFGISLDAGQYGPTCGTRVKQGAYLAFKLLMISYVWLHLWVADDKESADWSIGNLIRFLISKAISDNLK